jgi:arylsulfatase A-like enzyme
MTHSGHLQTLVICPSHTYGLLTDERTLPQALKDVGYQTAMVGKWHLGHADKKYWPQIVAALKQKNMLDNTLIIFSSDNGSATNALFATGARSPEEREKSGGVELGAKPPASNGDLRGGKGSLHEGGVQSRPRRR